MTGLRITVDLDSGIPPWRQVRDQILRAITSGALPAGERLPTIRQLARDLGLASGTVARTYRELESEGWVRTARARGTVIAEAADAVDTHPELRAAAREFVERAGVLQVRRNVAMDAVLAAFETLWVDEPECP
ncbi:MAG: GntR family transcriptional regulator [Sciscionella sp.]